MFGSHGISVPSVLDSFNSKWLFLPAFNCSSTISTSLSTVSLPEDQAPSERSTSKLKASGSAESEASLSILIPRCSAVSTVVSGYLRVSCALVVSRFCRSLGMSLVEANKAAPRATAVIGSILVSTLSVICSVIIRRSVCWKVGPPTKISELKSLG